MDWRSLYFGDDEENQRRRPSTIATATPPPADGGGGFFGGLSKAAGAVGNFFGTMVEDVTDKAETAVSGVRDVLQGEAKSRELQKLTEEMNKINRENSELTQNLTPEDYDKPEIKAKLQELSKRRKQLNEKSQAITSSKDWEEAQAVDPLKTGAAAAETFLNFAGAGGALKAIGTGVVKQGAKVAGKEVLKKTQQEIAEEALKGTTRAAVAQTAGGAARRIAANAGEGALFGSAYGALHPLSTKGREAESEELWRSALFGGALGGVAGGTLSLLDKNVRTGAKKIPGAAKSEAAKLSPENIAANHPGVLGYDDQYSQLAKAYDNTTDVNAKKRISQAMAENRSARLDTMRQVTEGGYVGKGPAGPEDLDIDSLLAETDPIAGALDSAEQARRQLSGEGVAAVTDEDNFIQSVAEQYKTADDYVDEAARRALDAEKAVKGGQMIPDGEGGYKRTSDHAGWYRDYFQATGRKPSLAATRDIIEESLETGKGLDGVIAPEESGVYQLLKEREAGVAQTVAEGPPPDIAQTLPATPSTEPKFPNERGFFGTIKESDTATPQLKEAVAGVDPQTYTPTSNPELVARTLEIVQKDPAAARNRVLTATNLTDEDVAIGSHLMSAAQKEGNMADAVAIADKLDTSLRESGRAVQAASIWGRLTPEGTLRLASAKFRKAREKISAGRGFQKGVGGEEKIVTEIKNAVEGVPLTPDEITGVVRKAAKDMPETSVGERVADRVESAVTPKVKKKADTLVDELTKKIKQEMLPAKGKPVKKPAVETLREVFGRNAEAQEAFPEAQRILRERFKDNPGAQKLLDDFFSSELGLPSASSTIDRSIKEQLIKNETKISEIIYKSWNGQKQSVDDIAKALTKEGFDEQSAAVIAKETTDRLTAQTVMAKQKVLKQLAEEAPKKARVTYLDKIERLSNLGGLDDQDYLEMARAKLKLPQLTQETASKISSLAQQMQNLPEGAERDLIAKEIYQTVNDSIPATFGSVAADVASAPKSLMASYDLSGSIRQGGVLGARFRTEAKNAFQKQVKYFKNSEAYEKGMSAIRHDPLYETARKAGIDLTGVSGSEEAFVSQLPEKIPLLGKGISASNRAYAGGLTELRFNSFKHILNDLAAEGIDADTLGEETLKSIGKFINTASGRGSGSVGGTFEKMAPALNRTLFSPRLWKSRLDMLNPVYYYKLDPIARKYALESAGSFAAIAGTILGLASIAGAEVETDARSSDFLKIKAGDTRYDILGGFQQNLVFAWRELSGEKKSSVTGEIADLKSGDFGKANRLSILSDLVENKANPVISTAGDILKGTDKQGNPLFIPSAVAQLGIPLNVQETYSTGKEAGPLAALFGAAVPGTVGIGVQTYKEKPKTSKRKKTGRFEELYSGLRGY